MLLEKIIFNALAFSLFIIIFFKMIKKNDTNYVFILSIQALGILISFIEIIFKLNMGYIMKFLIYLLSVIIPIIIMFIEYKWMDFSEIIYISLAKIAILMGDTKLAKNFLITLVTKYHESYYGHKMLAEIYEKEGGMRKAIDEYVQAIQINKKDYDSYYKVSYLLNDLGKKKEASEMLEELLKKKPEMLDATILLGDIYCEQEKYKEAANIYNEALKYNLVSYELYYNMGIVYTMLNDFKNAKTCYEKAAEINTLLYNGYYNLAQISLIYNDLEEAEKYFMQSVLSKDVEPKAYYNLAKIYMIRGDKENAIRFLNIAIELDHNFYDKADKESIFISIKAYINYPNMDEEQIQENNLTPKEIKVHEHLEKTMKLVGKLSLNNIKLKKEKQYAEIDKEGQREKE